MRLEGVKPSIVTNTLTGFAFFFLGGVLSAVYNAWSLHTFNVDARLWHQINDVLDPAITGLSYVIPIVWRAEALLSAAGLETRAMIVHHLYGVDWIICLITSLFAVPSVIAATLRGSRYRMQELAAGRYAATAQAADKGLAVLLIVAIIALNEAWLGTFASEGRSVFFNRVLWRDADFDRLCVFLPFAEMFGSLVINGAYLKWKFRSSVRAR